MFQGGFAGRHVQISSSPSSEAAELTAITDIYPADNNAEQVFVIPPSPPAARIKVTFIESTDFYGRITVYKLDLIGEKAE